MAGRPKILGEGERKTYIRHWGGAWPPLYYGPEHSHMALNTLTCFVNVVIQAPGASPADIHVWMKCSQPRYMAQGEDESVGERSGRVGWRNDAGYGATLDGARAGRRDLPSLRARLPRRSSAQLGTSYLQRHPDREAACSCLPLPFRSSERMVFDVRDGQVNVCRADVRREQEITVMEQEKPAQNVDAQHFDVSSKREVIAALAWIAIEEGRKLDVSAGGKHGVSTVLRSAAAGFVSAPLVVSAPLLPVLFADVPGDGDRGESGVGDVRGVPRAPPPGRHLRHPQGQGGTHRQVRGVQPPSRPHERSR